MYRTFKETAATLPHPAAHLFTPLPEPQGAFCISGPQEGLGMKASVSLCAMLTAKRPSTSMCFFTSVPRFNFVLTTNTDKPHQNGYHPNTSSGTHIHSSPTNTLRTPDRRHHSLQGRELKMWWNTLSHLLTVHLHPTHLYQSAVFNNHSELRSWRTGFGSDPMSFAHLLLPALCLV